MGEKNTLLGVAFEYKSKQERKEIKKIIARVKKVRAPRRLASAMPLSKETLTEYALQSPYRIIHRILQIVSLRNRKMRF